MSGSNITTPGKGRKIHVRAQGIANVAVCGFGVSPSPRNGQYPDLRSTDDLVNCGLCLKLSGKVSQTPESPVKETVITPPSNAYDNFSALAVSCPSEAGKRFWNQKKKEARLVVPV